MNFQRRFFQIALAIIVLIVLYPIVLHFIQPKWDTAGQFGDSYGALNSLFSGLAFVGVIVTIALQREDAIETRNEVRTERIINIIYHQLPLMEDAIAAFSISLDGIELKGHQALLQLNKKFTEYYPSMDESVEQNLPQRKMVNTENYTLVSRYDDALNPLAIRIYNSTTLIANMLLNSGLQVAEIDSLRELWFSNIGFMHISLLRNCYQAFKEAVEIYNIDNNYNIDLSSFSQTQIFLKSILRFEGTTVTIANIEELRRSYTGRTS